MDGITVREIVPGEAVLDHDEQYTMFHPSEVELSETMKSILTEVEQLQPRRVVFDSLSELRLLAGNPLRYRRQILALKQFFRRPQLHRAAARRHDVVGSRSASAEHLARRDSARAAQPGVRIGPATRADCEVSRAAFSRRLSRLRNPARRSASLSSTGGGGASTRTHGVFGWPAASRRWILCSAAASRAEPAR